MKDLLNIAIYLTPIILTAITVTKRFAKAKTRSKIMIVGFLSAIVAISTYSKENIIENESKNEKQIAKIEQIKKDSLTEAKNDTDKLNIIRAFTDGFARYELKIDNLLAPISDIKIKSVSDGLVLSYQLNKPVENLKITLGPNPFDETSDESFGAGVVDLPRKIGKNVFKIKFDNIKFGQKITLLFKSTNPYYSLPIIDHYHTVNNTTDVIITADNTALTADSEIKIN